MFDTLTQTFVENEHGTFNAHHYRHSPRMSTFVVECDAATWQRAGFASMDEAATLTYLEQVFGHPPGVQQVGVAQLSRTCATSAGRWATWC